MSYSIWILEYGYVDRFPASNLFAAQPNEGHRRMPYCFGLLRSAERTVLVDVGFAVRHRHHEVALERGELVDQSREQLGTAGYLERVLSVWGEFSRPEA